MYVLYYIQLILFACCKFMRLCLAGMESKMVNL